MNTLHIPALTVASTSSMQKTSCLLSRGLNLLRPSGAGWKPVAHCLAAAMCISSAFAADWKAQLALAQKSGDNAAIAEICERKLAENPKDASALTALARAQFQLGDNERCRRTLGLWKRAAGKGSAEIDLMLGDLSRNENDMKSALRYWVQAVGADPPSGQAARNLGRYYFEKGAWKEAAGYLAIAQRLAPSTGDYPPLAEAHFHLRDWEELAKVTAASQKRDPRNKAILAWKALSERIERNRDLIQRLDNAIESAAGDKDSLHAKFLRRARVMMDIGLPRAGAGDGLNAVTLKPDALAARVVAGECLMQIGRREISAKLKVNSSRNRTSPDAKFLDALEKLDRALEKTPEDDALRLERAKGLRNHRHYVLALEDLEVAKKSKPESPDVHAEIALVLRATGESLKAHAEFAETLRLDGRNLTALEHLGRHAMRSGEYEKAIGLFERALAVQEKNKDIAALLADCRQSLRK